MHRSRKNSVLLLSLLPVALWWPCGAFALPAAHAKTPPKREAPKQPPTYEEAVKQEQALLENPVSSILPSAGLQFDDDELLKVIDQADREGKADSLPEPVARRLSEWRQSKEAEAAYDKAPWQHGPATVALDGPVSLELPKGYKYLSSAEAAKLVDAADMGGKPRALVASEDDTHVYAVEALETGHYDPTALQWDPTALKQALDDHYRSPLMSVPQPGDSQAQMLQNLLDKAEWLEEPRYDEKTHILAWSNTQPAQPPRVTAVRFGRTWSAEVRAVGGVGADVLLENARKLASGVRFQNGEEYADAIATDPRATTGIEKVISGGPNPMQQMVTDGFAASMERDQERRDSEVGRLLLRLGGPVLGLIALGIGAANRKKAAEAKPAADGEGSSPDKPTESG